MSITPQMIKDQDFQTKFRGYDPVEVKAYLDAIAEEFFELQERCRLQVEDLQAAHEEREGLEQQRLSHEAGSDEARKMAEELRQAGLRMEQKIAMMSKEAEGLQTLIAQREQEKKTLVEELRNVKERVRGVEEETARERAEKEALAHRIELMDEQRREARKDELDFKSTLTAAQQFCDSMKEKSRRQADQLLEATRSEIAAIRKDAHAELSRLPEEIKALHQKRDEARQVLRTTLESYLQNLDIFPAATQPDADRASEDLFQKIQILEDGSISPVDLAALGLDPGAFGSADGDNDLLSVFGGDDEKI
jgi:DivIVA domain-containing protein